MLNSSTRIQASVSTWLDAQIQEHRAVLDELSSRCGQSLFDAVELSANCIQRGGKILFCGNGGSAADAQHLATELTIRYKTNRDPIAAVALTTDTSALTACGNDFSFDEIFSRQVQAIGRPGDVLIGNSTSGNSRNIVRAFEQAKSQQLRTIAFVGGSKCQLDQIADLVLKVPSKTTARIQEMHIFLGHLWCELLEQRLGLVKGICYEAS